MSVHAIAWAFEPKEGMRMADKFVLVALADNADAHWRAWPAASTIARKTNMDLKTVRQALQRLEQGRWIADTGDRTGLTKQIKIFRLNLPEEDLQKRIASAAEEHIQKRTASNDEPIQKTPPLEDSEDIQNSSERCPKTGSQSYPKTGDGTVRGTVKEPPPCRPPEGTTGQEMLVRNFDHAKELICKMILGGKDPNRPWSYDATHALQRQLPIPFREIEVIAWFRNLPNDPLVPELAKRYPITENGLMQYWSDEVTRAEAFWRKVRPLAKKKDPPRWREFLRWKYGNDIRLPNEFEDLDRDQRDEYARDFETFQEATK